MIDSENGRRVFALEISGLIYRYHSTTPPSETNLDDEITSGINYIDRESIVNVGAFSASIDPSGGVGEYTPVSISLSIDRKNDIGDAGIIFGRCGARSISTSAQISQSVERDDSFIRVSSSLTSLTYPRLLHIGSETIRVNQALTSILLTPSGRGVGNTPIQTHSISLDGSSVPEVSTEITTFRGRRVKLFGAHQFADGSTSNYIEIINGIIESTPTIDDGQTVSLSIVPLTALIDTSLSDKISQTRLVNGYHYFDGQYASMLEYATELNGNPLAHIVGLINDSASVTASTYQIFTSTNDRQISGQRGLKLVDFDTSLPKGAPADRYSIDHPRYPRFESGTDYNEKASYPTAITDITSSTYNEFLINADSTLPDTLTANELGENILLPVPRTELKRHSLGNDEIKRFPDVINETLQSDGANDITGFDGAVAKWRLDPDNKIIATKTTGSTLPASVYIWTTQAAWIAHSRDYRRRPRHFDSVGDSLELDTLSRLFYPLDIGENDDPFIDDPRLSDSGLVKKARIDPTAATGQYQLRDIAKGYYQLYESKILVENSLGLPTSATAGVYYFLTVRYYDRRSDSTRDQFFEATHETVATFGGSDIGRLIHLRAGQSLERNRSFGDWRGKERTLIMRGGRFVGERVGVALLKLLQSGGGGEINGSYDVLNVGLNISSSEIDEESFLSVDSTSPFLFSEQYAGDGSDIRSTFESICKLLGAVLVMKRDETTGRSRLALVSIGAERSANTKLNIKEGDWFVDPPPAWDIYEDIITQIEFNYDYDPAEENYKSTVLFNDQEAINRYGGERSKISLSLAGVSSDQFGRGAGDSYDQFLPTAGRLFNLLANPLRLWRGAISTGSSIFLDLGAYIKATSKHLKGYDDSYGVTNGIGMIRSINQQLMNEGCDLEIITTGLNVVAWNSSANVATIDSSTAISVYEDTYSDERSDDISFFNVGNIVDYVPTGDQDNSIIGLTILSIVNNTITFSTPHNITSAAGSIESTTYASASENHRIDAYLANVSNVINSTIEAQKYN